MKPKNFPERKNKRRKVALENLLHRNADQDKHKHIRALVQALLESVVPSRREQRSKKQRVSKL